MSFEELVEHQIAEVMRLLNLSRLEAIDFMLALVPMPDDVAERRVVLEELKVRTQQAQTPRVVGAELNGGDGI